MIVFFSQIPRGVYNYHDLILFLFCKQAQTFMRNYHDDLSDIHTETDILERNHLFWNISKDHVLLSNYYDFNSKSQRLIVSCLRNVTKTKIHLMNNNVDGFEKKGDIYIFSEYFHRSCALTYFLYFCSQLVSKKFGRVS